MGSGWGRDTEEPQEAPLLPTNPTDLERGRGTRCGSGTDPNSVSSLQTSLLQHARRDLTPAGRESFCTTTRLWGTWGSKGFLPKAGLCSHGFDFRQNPPPCSSRVLPPTPLHTPTGRAAAMASKPTTPEAAQATAATTALWGLRWEDVRGPGRSENSSQPSSPAAPAEKLQREGGQALAATHAPWNLGSHQTSGAIPAAPHGARHNGALEGN